MKNRKKRDPICVHFPLLLNRRINCVFIGLLAFMHVLCWTVYLCIAGFDVFLNIVYFCEVVEFTHQFRAWLVEVDYRSMHKSVRLKNQDDCRIDWSISATSIFSVINNFCREWMVMIESTDKDLMVQMSKPQIFMKI